MRDIVIMIHYFTRDTIMTIVCVLYSYGAKISAQIYVQLSRRSYRGLRCKCPTPVNPFFKLDF